MGIAVSTKSLSFIYTNNTHREPSLIVRAGSGKRFRIYAGHTSQPQRWRRWKNERTRGVYIRLWFERVVGVQWWPK